jgi:hypothetical protein
MNSNNGRITNSVRQILSTKQFNEIMSRHQYKFDTDGNIIAIDPVTLVEQKLQDINTNPKPKIPSRKSDGGKSKRKKSRSKKYKNRRVNKTRRCRK